VESRDVADAAPVAVINDGLARALFPAGDAVGRQIRLQNQGTEPVWRTIVGVVEDIRYQGVENPFVSAIYTPFAQTPFPWSYVMVRSGIPAERLAAALRSAIAGVDARMTPAVIQPHGEVVTGLVAQRRLVTTLLVVFAALAIVLSAIGIYGVIAYGVAQRRREIGVRLVLGAEPWRVIGRVVGGAVTIAAGGMAAGLVASFWLTRLLGTMLYGVDARDPMSFAVGATLVLAVAVLASAVPAVRASRVPPAVVLRD
jgi:putative ABC transport system permease protein